MYLSLLYEARAVDHLMVFAKDVIYEAHLTAPDISVSLRVPLRNAMAPEVNPTLGAVRRVSPTSSWRSFRHC